MQNQGPSPAANCVPAVRTAISCSLPTRCRCRTASRISSGSGWIDRARLFAVVFCFLAALLCFLVETLIATRLLNFHLLRP